MLLQENSDARLLKSTQLLQNIKLIKLYSWETLFYGFVDSIRKKELQLRFRAAVIRVMSGELKNMFSHRQENQLHLKRVHSSRIPVLVVFVSLCSLVLGMASDQ